MEQPKVSSQQIAFVLMCVGYVLLVPSIPAVFVGVVVGLFLEGPGTPIDPDMISRGRVMMVLRIVAVFLCGCVLLWGYRRHAYGKLALGGSLLLWIATVVYNAGLLVSLEPTQLLSQPNPMIVMFALWQFVVIVLALVAAFLNLRQRFERTSEISVL